MGNLTLNGATSGQITLSPTAVAGTNTITLPAATGTVALTNTAVFNSATTLSLQTGGTTGLYIDASQNVGIGTTSPSSYAKFAVGGYIASGGQNYSARFSDAVNSSYFIAHQSGLTNLITDQAMAFYTSSTERMRIDSSGNLLVGTTSSPSNARFRAYGNASADFNFGPQTGAGNNAFVVYNQSNVGVYLVSGNTSWTASSDENLKNITGTIQNALEKVSTLRAAEYTWKSDNTNKPRVGLIAQDVQKVLPEVVDTNSDGYLGVSYAEVVPLLVAAIQELKATVDAQAATIAVLEAKVGA